MYQVIARKYRPQSFAELIGQEHVRHTLENAIQQRRIAHGYIFAGQRGTGKTTVARIMARCLNCLQGPTITPCGVCASCIEVTAGNSVDVIEIDAASNRGINEMRELRESVRYRPARDRYKVFIIDEAHQITNEAFNALLKTLEEPPEWVVFILCTTEAHKIPTTIASRCQQYSFRSVDFRELVGRMEYICGEEGISADPDALAVLAQAGEGSVRDSLSALDQAIACCGTTLAANDVRNLLGMFSLDSLRQVSDALQAGNARTMLEVVQELERNGHSLPQFCRELARYWRNLLVLKVAGLGTTLVAASPKEQESLAAVATQFGEEDLTRYLQMTLDLYRDLQFSLQPRLQLEIGLLKLVHASRLVEVEDALAKLDQAGPAAPPPAPRASAASAAAPARPAAGAVSAPLPPPARPVAAAPPPALAPKPAPFSPPLPKAATPVAAAPPPPPVVNAPAAAPPAPKPSAPAGDGSSKVLLSKALREADQNFTADAVDDSEVVETPTELQITTPKAYRMSIKASDIEKVMQGALGKKLRVKITFADIAISTEEKAPAKSANVEELEQQVRSLPEFQRFEELFPGSQIRDVRNLKD